MGSVNEATLEEIFDYIDKDACDRAHVVRVNAAGNIVQRLTAKKLEEGEVPLVAEVAKGKNESAVRVCFYANGFAMYCAEDRKTILDVAQCLEYVYKYGLKTDWLPKLVAVPGIYDIEFKTKSVKGKPVSVPVEVTFVSEVSAVPVEAAAEA